MAAVLLDLEDCVVTDSGEVYFRFDRLIDHANDGNALSGLKALPHPHVDIYNKRNPSRAIPIADIDGEVTEIPKEAFAWTIPEKYKQLDIAEYLGNCLVDKIPEAPEIYTDRLVEEWIMMQERQMEDFIRSLIYMVDIFEANRVVHGVGRGSACASLVLYLIGIHMVDPIKFEIPISEFLR